MSMFRRGLPLILIGLVVIYSCGAIDGGSRGTGITSTIEGSVAAVQISSDQPTSVKGIKVIVPGRARTVTNSDGVFSVQGSFWGALDMMFVRRADGIRASYHLDIPSGGTMSLNAVRIDATTNTVTVDSESIDYLGVLTQIDCAAQTIVTMAAKQPPADTDTYTIMLNNSSVVDSQGNPVSCSALTIGQIAHMQCAVESDNTFGSCTVVLQ